MRLGTGGARRDRRGVGDTGRAACWRRRASSSGGSARAGPVDDDLRPAVRALPAADGAGATPARRGGACRLRAELATQPRGVRPGEFVEGLGADLVLARACRTHQWIERDGARWEPLARADGRRTGSRAPHATERAS